MTGRGNRIDLAGWAAVTDALEHLTCLTSLNGCCQYSAIRAGEMESLKLDKQWELALWAMRFLECSASTLTLLDVRYASFANQIFVRSVCSKAMARDRRMHAVPFICQVAKFNNRMLAQRFQLHRIQVVGSLKKWRVIVK